MRRSLTPSRSLVPASRRERRDLGREVAYATFQDKESWKLRTEIESDPRVLVNF